MLFEFSIDLEDQLTRLLGKYHIVVPSSIVKELGYLSLKGDSKKRMNAKASLKLVEKYDIFEIEGKTGDESVIQLAKKIDGIVVTNDVELRKKLKDLSVSVVFLRAKKKLELE
jgi:rRNA-processing protein FCF1